MSGPTARVLEACPVEARFRRVLSAPPCRHDLVTLAARSGGRFECDTHSGALLMAGKEERRAPPRRMPLKEALGNPSGFLVVRGQWELFVTPDDDDTPPLSVGQDFVDFHADKWILPHPLDFLAQCGVTIEVVVLEVDMYGNDVRLVAPGARQAGEARRDEHLLAFCLLSSRGLPCVMSHQSGGRRKASRVTLHDHSS